MANNKLRKYEELKDGQLTLLPSNDSCKTRGEIMSGIMDTEISSATTELTFMERPLPELDIKSATRVTLCAPELGNGFEMLTRMDWMVHDAVGTLAMYCDYFSVEQIYRCMTGNLRAYHINDQKVQVILASLEKMRHIDVSWELPSMVQMEDGRIVFPISSNGIGSMLPIELYTPRTGLPMSRLGCRALAVPPMFRHAQNIGKVSTFPLKLLDTPINKNVNMLLAQDYLLRRIDLMNRHEADISAIPWAAVWDAGQWEAATQGALASNMLKMRKRVYLILDYWVQFGFIQKYIKNDRRNGGILVTPNFEYHIR